MFRGAAQLIEKRLDPGCGQLGAIGVKMAGEAPEVLAAVIEVQGFGSFGEAIFDQVLYPECPVSRTENFFGASQSQAHRRCPLPPRLAQPPRSRAPFLESCPPISPLAGRLRHACHNGGKSINPCSSISGRKLRAIKDSAPPRPLCQSQYSYNSPGDRRRLQCCYSAIQPDSHHAFFLFHFTSLNHYRLLHGLSLLSLSFGVQLFAAFGDALSIAKWLDDWN